MRLLIFFLLATEPFGAKMHPASTTDTVSIAAALNAIEKNPDSVTLEAIDAIRQQALQVNYPPGVAKTFFCEGIWYFQQENYSGSIVSFQRAREAYGAMDDRLYLGRVYHWIGNAYYFKRNFQKALENHLAALSIRETIHDKKGLAQSLYNIGNIYNDEKQFDKALEFHLRSLTIKREINDTRGIGYSYNNIALVYLNLRRYRDAEHFFSEALQLFIRMGNTQGRAYVIGNIAELREQTRDFGDARKKIKRAIRLLETINDSRALAEAYNQLGSIELQLNHYSACGNALFTARTLGASIDVPDQVMENYRLLSMLDSARGNNGQSLRHYKQYIHLKDSLFNNERLLQIENLQANYDSDKKEKEISLLKAERTIDSANQRNEITQLLSLIAVCALIIIFLIYVVTQEQRVNKALVVEKKALNDLNQLKDRLLSILSHDLRGPVANLKSILALYEKGNLSGQDLNWTLRSIHKSVDNVSNLLENLLFWARHNLSDQTPQISNFPIYLLVKENFELLQSACQQKCLQCVDLTDQSAWVSADKNLVNMVLRNLISNAIKFSLTNGRIEVASRMEDAHLIISVKDNGVGISEAVKTKLFGTVNISTPGTSNEKGTGLGLMLCKESIEKSKGEIWVESEPNVGSTFFFTLPLSCQMPVEDQKLRAVG